MLGLHPRVEPVDLLEVDLGGDDFRQNWFDLAARWATRPPFQIAEGGKLSLVCARYADVRDVLLDPKRFTILNTDPAFRRLAPYKGVKTLTSCDGDDHARQRRVMMLPFAPRNIQPILDRAEVVIAETLDAIEARAPGAVFDARGDFAAPVMERLLLDEMFRMTSDQARAFSVMNETRSALARLRPGEEPAADFLEAFEAARQALSDMIRDRRANPGDDFLSGLLTAEEDAQRLSDEEVLGSLFGIASATTGSTPSAAALALFTLCRHPEQLAALRANQDLAGSAMEECLRYHPPLYLSFPRFATEDTAVGGVPVSAGTAVQLLLAATNLDPMQYADPLRFDIARKPAQILPFGAGPHVCIASRLARGLMQRLVMAVIARWPNLRLAEAGFHPRYIGTVGEFVPATLPLAP